MCRSIPLRKVESENFANLTTPRFTKYIHPVRYEPANYIFDSTADEESCYYNDLENQNLPRGILGIQKANQCHHLYRPSPGHSIGEKVLLA